jgi:hypothetical protein
MIRRSPAANDATGAAALWNLPGLADLDVHDTATAATAIHTIMQNAALPLRNPRAPL